MDSPPAQDQPAFETVRYLTGSDTRIRILALLTAEPLDRRTLRDRLDISQPTTSRTLSEFEDRGWVTHEGRTFRATELGSFVCRSLTSFLEQMKTARRLEPIVQWFPAEGYGFDLDCLASADIVTASEVAVEAPIESLGRQLRDASHVRSLSHGITRSLLDVQLGASSAGAPVGCWIFGPEVREYLRDDPELAAFATAALESGRMEFYCYDGPVPFNVVVTDDTVNLCLTGGQGAPNAEIQTTDEEVRAWADATIDEYRRDADRLTTDSFDP